MKTKKGIAVKVLKFNREVTPAKVEVEKRGLNEYVVYLNLNNVGLIWRYPDIALGKRAQYWKTSMNGEKFKTRREAIRHCVKTHIGWDMYFNLSSVSDETIEYKAIGPIPGQCRRAIWKDGDKYIVLFQDIFANKGTSVINWFARLATQFITEFKVSPNNVVFYQNDPHEPRDYSQVTLTWDATEGKATDYSFQYGTIEAFQMLIS